ncbi:MAG: 2-amino-4-hydroxy-6-hydroxymethyldihydropteridine diphosphokinase [Chloroflexi bacterium]|nr:MAG: 2-amino-4-hydroxy-6-hydroxymethyldihydropteridine diphosphokinase [Chloroflexota bacterium]
MTRAWLALGSNLGDRAAYLASARAALEREGIQILTASTVLETEPVGVTEQPAFLNQVLEVETQLQPRSLLDTVKRLERELGRSPGPRWGPREIDIDILRYQGLQVDEPGLTIPHPEIGHRPFLRRLLAEIGAP